MLIWKAILVLSAFGICFISYNLGYLDFIIKDWKRSWNYAKIYMAITGLGLHIYWLYLIVTNA
jgi:hypothetical protein